MIEISGLTKRFGSKTVLDDVSVRFEDNRIYGFLGSNGAGKTTLLKIITNRLFPTGGEVLVDGEVATENESVQSDIFCVTEGDRYPKDLSAADLFTWESRFYRNFDMEYAIALAEKFDLDTGKRVKSLSTGYYTIFKLVVTLASNARIIILDEPVLGIDSLYREMFYDVLLTHHQKHENLVIIATHLIDEVERVLDDVVIISGGKIIKNEEIGTLTGGRRLNEVYVRMLKEAKGA